MKHEQLVILSYHHFVEQYAEPPYVFSRTYDQFWHDIRKKTFDWITIDDARESITLACHMMREINVRAKIFVPTSLVGKPGYCSWQQLRIISQHHDIENHSHDHVKGFSGRDRIVIEADIVLAQRFIAENIGREPRYFVSPYNDYECPNQVEMITADIGLTCLKDRITIKFDTP